jgi:hypothetical protein
MENLQLKIGYLAGAIDELTADCPNKLDRIVDGFIVEVIVEVAAKVVFATDGSTPNKNDG